jgi:homoserine O-succinyltransferase/O-acetyltransferase
MPASLNSNPSSTDKKSCTGLCANPSAKCLERLSKSLHIGLVNNMPDGALEATERQFLSLLNSASEGFTIRLSLFALPGIPRGEAAERHIGSFYSSTETLRETNLDGLIVTGREPLAPGLRDEPYWESFTRLLEWARDNTHSTVWSCLAAHAAVLHMDGIQRIRSKDKHCGIFECERLSDHPLTAGASSGFKLPHSRWNGISEDALKACGYDVLTRSADAGVDMFVKQLNSLFVFFQGHPEYESNTLLFEYRRDVSRYLRGETETYPLTPQSYFDQQTANALTALREQAMSCRREELLAELSSILAEKSIENNWHSTAGSIYRSWLQYIAERKSLRLQNSRPVVSGTPGIAGSTATSGSLAILGTIADVSLPRLQVQAQEIG